MSCRSLLAAVASLAAMPVHAQEGGPTKVGAIKVKRPQRREQAPS